MNLTHVHRKDADMSYIYILILGVILCIIGLWLLLPKLEGMADTSTMMLVAIRDSGDATGRDFGIAKIGLSSNPNWNILGKSMFITGSFDNLVLINPNGTLWHGTGITSSKQNETTSDKYNFTQIGSVANAIQVSYDYPTIVYIDTNNIINYADYVSSNPVAAIFSKTTSGKQFSWISAYMGAAYAIGVDGVVWYTENVRVPDWKNTSSNISGVFTRVSFDNNEAVIVDTTGKTYYTRNATDVQPSWIQLDGLSKHVSIKNHFLYRIDTANILYFATSPTSSSISWTRISDKILHVECIYQRSSNMITRRLIKPTICTNGTWEYANKCLNACPAGYTANTSTGKCVGNPITRALRPVTTIPPPTYTCPVGTSIVLGSDPVCKNVITGGISSSPPVLEVFLANGSYTRTEAENKCMSYGASLATEQQLKDAQATGAGWCLDGWLADEGVNPQNLTCFTADCYAANNGDLKPVLCPTKSPSCFNADCYAARYPELTPALCPLRCDERNAPKSTDPSWSVGGNVLNCYMTYIDDSSIVPITYGTFGQLYIIDLKPATLKRAIKTGQLQTWFRYTYSRSSGDNNCKLNIEDDFNPVVVNEYSVTGAQIDRVMRVRKYGSMLFFIEPSTFNSIIQSYPATDPSKADCDAALLNHYNNYGNAEQRDPCCEITKAQCDTALLNHYNQYGKTEGRKPCCPLVNMGRGGYPKQNGTCGTSSTGAIVSNWSKDGKHPAICYGIRPQQNTPDILPFSDKWAGTNTCPPLYALNYPNASCKSGCPTGSSSTNTQCVYPIEDKETKQPVATNFTCPAGFDAPNYTTCDPGTTCNMSQQCYESCPSGYTRNGTTCQGTSKATGVKAKTQIQATISSLSYSCAVTPVIGSSPPAFTIPRGNFSPIDLLSGRICSETCPAGYTDTGSFCQPPTGSVGNGKMLNPAREIPNYSCPAGYTLSGNMCTNTICDINYTETPDGLCAPNIATRRTTVATYTPRCPAGYTEYSGMCYKDCGAGYNSIQLTKCQIIPNTKKVGEITITPSPIKLCNDDEEIQDTRFGPSCVKKCDLSSTTQETTTCTPLSIIPPIAYETELCNKNETLKGGVCVTTCPDGKFPDGELCIGDPKIVEVPSTIKCMSSSFGSVKKWLCPTQADADILLKNPSPITSYVNAKDQICVTDDPTTLMYFCQTAEEARNNTGYDDDIRNNYYSTCDQLMKNLIDIKNSIETIKTLQDNLSQGTLQLSGANITLTTIYKKLKCDTTPLDQNVTICQILKRGSDAIDLNSTDVNKTFNSIMINIQTAFSAQKSVLTNVIAFNCK